jgi:signal transduction histidine kinase
VDADLELLLISVFCTADDLLPEARKNAQRRLSDAEVLTLCVAQVIMDLPSDRRFLRAARRQLGGLFPYLPTQSALHKRRAALRDTFDWLCGVFAGRSPGAHDPVVLLDSTPVEAGRSVDTARRSELADAAGYGYSRSHSRWFWGFRLHLACSPDGTPRAAILVGADRKEREIARTHLLPHIHRSCHTIVADKGYAGRELAEAAETLGITIIRPRRRDEPKTRQQLRLSTIRQRIESVFWTLKDLLSLERHGARTLHNLRARIGCRLLCLAACVHLNHQLGRPTRSLAPYTA